MSPALYGMSIDKFEAVDDSSAATEESPMADSDEESSLSSEGDDVLERIEAIHALLDGGHLAVGALPQVLACLTDFHPEVRRTAVWALGKLEDVTSLPCLEDVMALLKDEDGSVRRAAAWAAYHLAPASLLHSDAILALAHHTCVETRAVAARILGHLGRQAIHQQGILAKALRDTAPKVRRSAAWALGKVCAGDVGRAVVLEQLLDDDNKAVQLATLSALGDIGEGGQPSTALLSRMTSFSTSRNDDLRDAALQAVCRTAAPRLWLACLILQSSHSSAWPQPSATNETTSDLLELCCDVRHLCKVLATYVQHERPAVRSHAVWVLGATEALKQAETTQELQSRVFGTLEDEDTEVRKAALELAASWDRDLGSHIDMVVSCCFHEDEDVSRRACACLSAASIQKQVTPERLRRLIEDGKGFVRASGLRLLAGLEAPVSSDWEELVVEVLVEDDCPEVKVAAIASLGCLEQAALDNSDDLIDCLTHDDSEVRLAAAALLRKLRRASQLHPEAVSHLLCFDDTTPLIESNPNFTVGIRNAQASDQLVREAVLHAFLETGSAGTKHAKALAALLFDRFWLVRRDAILILSMLGKAGAAEIEMVLRRLRQTKDKDVREATAEVDASAAKALGLAKPLNPPREDCGQ
eukprot:TRINITY_DN24591_c0_g1_i2.p1 TRINITY_DN24591_c0_g1~~TRINITY_DN24591_c0_g1_i2.p1  ORF type:complete len:642 (+),score=123.43 TRINITY_DN24591_c0_g1_i2:63-1988(+)